MELEFRDAFPKDVKKIREAAVRKRIAAVISEARAASSLLDLKNVKELESNEVYYRIRVGNYRIGCKLEDQRLIFMRCLHRKDIYRYFP